ncbi:MAG: glycine betaine ABC transporter substrate-binding protein [Nocardioidaceae bacterium]
MSHSTMAVRLTALTAALTLVVAGCGDDGGGEASSDELSGKTFTVGSKEFTEQKILGAIAIRVLEDAGATVKDETGIEGTPNVRAALEAGEIDMYWEYTGTGFIELLGNSPADAPKDPQELFDAVAEQDSANGIKWINKSEANDTYAFATSQATSDELGVTSISDFAELANSDPESATLCAAAEFLDREDGFPGVEEEYGFDLPDAQITEVELDIIYTALPDADPCAFGEVFESAGQIPANDLVVLEDDKQFFPGYEVAMTIKEEVLADSPEVEEVLAPVAEALTTEELQQLNAQVDVEGLPVEAVAEKWLEENGLIG